MRQKMPALTLLLAFAIIGSLAGQSSASIIFTGTPVDSWGYYREGGAGKGTSTSYFPTTTAEFAGTVFQGYGTYEIDAILQGTDNGEIDTFHVFTTHVMSTADITIQMRADGDDGHSIFIDDAFIAGGGFGAKLDFDLELLANVSRKLTLAGYNAGGPSVFAIGLKSGSSIPVDPIDGVPGVELDADGFGNVVVPEPSAFAIWTLLGGVCLVGYLRGTKQS